MKTLLSLLLLTATFATSAATFDLNFENGWSVNFEADQDLSTLSSRNDISINDTASDIVYGTEQSFASITDNRLSFGEYSSQYKRRYKIFYSCYSSSWGRSRCYSYTRTYYEYLGHNTNINTVNFDTTPYTTIFDKLMATLNVDSLYHFNETLDDTWSGGTRALARGNTTLLGFTVDGIDATTIRLAAAAQSVPEPSILILSSLGLLGLAFSKRKTTI